MLGAKIIQAFGYENCVELNNASTRVILEPNCGGRVMSYALDGIDVIYTEKADDGWTLASGKPAASPFSPTGGCMDIGPEMIIPRHDQLRLGDWYAKITGPRSVRLVSQEDASVGLQLIREYELHEENSHLRVTQHIINVSDSVKQVCHRGCTLTKGGGICLAPLNPYSRFPRGYIVYGPGDVMEYRPDDTPNIRIREGIFEIIGPAERHRFALDAVEGWIACLTRENRLYIKTFDIDPDLVYGEIAAHTVSIHYHEDSYCLIEPVGPLEILEPGESAAFSEDWRLYDYHYPENKDLDYDEMLRLIDAARVTSIIED